MPVIAVGLFLIGLGCWLAYGQWGKVAQWPRTNATLVSKDVFTAGTRLVFDYEVGGRGFTGSEVRLGSEKSLAVALESYKTGTSQRISYNPGDPSEVETILNYNWELFEAPVIAGIFGVLLIFGGLRVYRWSYQAPANENGI